MSSLLLSMPGDTEGTAGCCNPPEPGTIVPRPFSTSFTNNAGLRHSSSITIRPHFLTSCLCRLFRYYHQQYKEKYTYMKYSLYFIIIEILYNPLLPPTRKILAFTLQQYLDKDILIKSFLFIKFYSCQKTAALFLVISRLFFYQFTS